MSRKSAYKQALSIGTAVVLGFALFTGRSTGRPDYSRRKVMSRR